MFIQTGRFRGKTIEFSVPLCVLNKHSPDRGAAKWDGSHYVSYCCDCGKDIRRKARNNWRKDWMKKGKRAKQAR